MEAWSALSSQTIVNGFRKCQLLPRSTDNNSAAEEADSIADIVVEGGLLDALVARRVSETRRVHDEY